MAGEIVHLELPSRNFERSAAFYGKLFGWRPDGAQSGGHLLFETPAADSSGADAEGAAVAPPVGGSWILHALAQAPGPLPFVAVDDIDATLADVERLGGRILVPRLPLAGRGEFGLLADPDGNVIAVLAKAGGGGGGGGSSGGGAAPRPAAATARSPEAAKSTPPKTTGGVRSKEGAKEKSGDSSGKPGPAPRAAAGKVPSKAGSARKR